MNENSDFIILDSCSQTTFFLYWANIKEKSGLASYTRKSGLAMWLLVFTVANHKYRYFVTVRYQ